MEWTVQLLQLRTRTRAPSTMRALDVLEQRGEVSAEDAAVLRDSYRFCERTRNRWWLVGSAPTAVDSLPTRPQREIFLPAAKTCALPWRYTTRDHNGAD